MILNNVLCCLLQYFLYSLISNVRSLKNLSWTVQKKLKTDKSSATCQNVFVSTPNSSASVAAYTCRSATLICASLRGIRHFTPGQMAGKQSATVLLFNEAAWESAEPLQRGLTQARAQRREAWGRRAKRPSDVANTTSATLSD